MPCDTDRLYDRSFFNAQSFESLESARIALPELFRHVRPQSALDVGCGVGTWLRAAGEFGVQDCLGVDGDYVDRRALMVPEELFLPLDLAQPGLAEAVAAHRHPPGRFDLVMCLEVAEHLPLDRSASLVDDLCRLGDLVLFSAAIPFQHGTGHINEQWPEFWAIQFRARGYACFDLLRRTLWGHPGMGWWYAQNLLVFAREGSEACSRLPAEARTAERPLALVHPEGWLSSILNQWRPHRAAAREEEPNDLRALLRAWTAGAPIPPLLQAVERARSAPPQARDVFPFTRTEVDEPERVIAAAARAAAELRIQLDGERALLGAAEKEIEGLRAQLSDARQEGESLRVRLGEAETAEAAAQAEQSTLRGKATMLQAANTTLRGQVTRHEVALAEAVRAAAELPCLRVELAALAAQVEAGRAAEEREAALLASTSWRITAPLRKLRRMFG